jgi:hypothetical protein
MKLKQKQNPNTWIIINQSKKFYSKILEKKMEQIMQMQDDIHKLKKMMDSVFEKMHVFHSLL